jgi:signal transduction histidine kinase
VTTAATFFMLYETEKTSIIDSVSIQESNLISNFDDIIHSEIHQVDSDIRLFRDQVNTLEHSTSLTDIENFAFNLAIQKKNYSQIRYLSNDGDELVRVDFNKETPLIISDSLLQNKKNRYYFQDAIQLDFDMIYVSPFDLNVEYNSIVTPLQPMIRFATPVIKNDLLDGIVVLNFKGDVIRDKINKLKNVSNGKLLLLNKEGYYFVGATPEQEWGFMYPEKKHVSLKQESPLIWDRIINKKDSQFILDGNIYTSSIIYPLDKWHITSNNEEYDHQIINFKDHKWVFISLVTANYIEQQTWKTLNRYRHYFNSIALILLIVLWITHLIYERKKATDKAIRENLKKLESQHETILKQKKRLERQKNTLLRNNSTKDRLLSIISHDLISPFNVLVGYTNMLHNDYDELNSNTSKKLIKQIDDTAEETLDMTKRLLMWANNQFKKTQINMEPILISDLIDRNCTLLTRQANRKEIQIINKLDKDLHIYADVDILDVVFRNLISNAIKFSHEHGIIEVSNLHIDEDKVEITVQDYGVGMDSITLSKVLNKNTHHSQTGTNNEKGTGLGLQLVSEFLERMGSSIDITSEKGKGTKISFILHKS